MGIILSITRRVHPHGRAPFSNLSRNVVSDRRIRPSVSYLDKCGPIYLSVRSKKLNKVMVIVSEYQCSQWVQADGISSVGESAGRASSGYPMRHISSQATGQDEASFFSTVRHDKLSKRLRRMRGISARRCGGRAGDGWPDWWCESREGAHAKRSGHGELFPC
jgi:hypothetical protein